MKTLFKIFAWIAGSVVVLTVVFVLFVYLTWEKKFEADYPNIKSTSDSAVVARGKYLAFGPAHCNTCHIAPDQFENMEAGMDVLLTGGTEMHIGPGIFRPRNLTPDMETGIGKLTDGEVARVMRHSIGADGRIIFPFMPFQNMSDEDMTALISFLRSQKPVKNEIKPTEYSFLGKMVLALGMLKPESASGTPPAHVEIGPTVEYGKYLANSVANCVGCHSPRSLTSGEFTGPKFSGGLAMDEGTGYVYVTPNLTPDPETGRIANWTEEAFIERIKNGRLVEGSPMPWANFSWMENDDLRAIYRYLHSLDPVSNKVEKTVYTVEEYYEK